MLSATLMIVALGFFASEPALSQLTPPSTAGAKPKTVAAVPIRPALDASTVLLDPPRSVNSFPTANPRENDERRTPESNLRKVRNDPAGVY